MAKHDSISFANPFRPGAGHPPPYLAGRSGEQAEFERLLGQDRILENCVLTGLRGVGKTVLLETLKPRATHAGWLWVGTDLSESSSVTEENLALRVLTDLAVVTSSFIVGVSQERHIGFDPDDREDEHRLTFNFLNRVFENTPGLVSDKLKSVLTLVWECIQDSGHEGIVFAYDEAQSMSDHPGKEQYPLALMLDVFQSIQRQGMPFMLVLTGLPTLFPKLVEARTYSERMFRIVFLDKLSPADSRDAITKPIDDASCPIKLDDDSIEGIIQLSAGYPYFVQFICREVYDAFLAQALRGETARVPVNEIERKLDSDFFAGRWARATDRQRSLLYVIATLPHCDREFSLQDVVECSKKVLTKSFSSSHVNQMLASLGNAGLIYKNRHGRYSFAVPLLGSFILRQDVDGRTVTTAEQ